MGQGQGTLPTQPGGHLRLVVHCLTERKGSPHTLVCTKTRRTYERQCEQHRVDCASMNNLIGVMQPLPDALAALAGRLTEARGRKPQP